MNVIVYVNWCVVGMLGRDGVRSSSFRNPVCRRKRLVSVLPVPDQDLGVSSGGGETSRRAGGDENRMVLSSTCVSRSD